jgi:hypothetical protein
MDSAKKKLKSLDFQKVIVTIISGLITFGLIALFVWLISGPSSRSPPNLSPPNLSPPNLSPPNLSPPDLSPSPPDLSPGSVSSNLSQSQMGVFGSSLSSNTSLEASPQQMMAKPQVRYRGVQVYSRPEVFNVKDNVYRYPEAEDCCKNYGARVATRDELARAQKIGANWCNMGWLTSQDAYYPTQLEQVRESSKWSAQFQGGCGRVGINGGFYPSQLKLGVNCYGIKPVDTQNVNPWNTVNKKWSQYT